ncbi:MAG: mtaA [Acidobacteria bacterium]|nr:mtaA [Acidobacteriota bacterium]
MSDTLPTPAEVQIWFLPTASLDTAAIAAAVATLSDHERARYRRFHVAPDARDYAAAHALLRTTLSRGTARPPRYWRFENTAAGKPLLRNGDAPVGFSLSHTRGMVACAVTDDAEIGVDLECIDRAVDAGRISARFFAAAEAAALAQLDETTRGERFFDLWTLKEALVKALGAGMALSMDRLAFTVDSAGGVRVEAPPDVDGDAWQFGLFSPIPRYRLAVAVRPRRPGSVRLILRSAAPSHVLRS